MKIQSYDMALAAHSQFVKAERTKVTYEVFEARQPNSNAVQLDLSANTGLGSVEETDEMFHLSEEDQAKIRLLEKLISALTGKTFKFNQVVKLERGKQQEMRSQPVSDFTPAQPAASAPKVYGIRIEASRERMESESMTFASKGVVKTSDGRTIDFEMAMHMSRSYYEKSEFAVQIGERLQDPLVINLDGKGIAFGDETIRMDLTLNGEVDAFRMLAEGSGFLAIDANGNGTVDDGSELFGPTTGRGFVELAAHDEDGNQWIDESDAIFSSLKIWTVGAQGDKTLIGLKEAGVGAIFLGSVNSPYHIKEGNHLVGKIRESGVYLKENGMAGAVHEIDLKI